MLNKNKLLSSFTKSLRKEVKMGDQRVKGGVVIEGRAGLDFHIPEDFVKIFKGRPRVVWKKVEWYGIHPLPVDVLNKEFKDLMKNYDIVAVPKGMI